MNVAPGNVVSFEYTLYAPDGSIIDASQETPLTYLHGAGHIVPGLESQLLGKVVGDELEAIVPAEDGYGVATGHGFHVDLSELPPGLVPQIGMSLGATGPDGKNVMLYVVELDEAGVTLTPDHPLSGMTLRFAVAIRSIRAATPDELAHGHSHGHDGHDHSHGR